MRTGKRKHVLGQFDQAGKARAAAGKDQAGGDLRVEAGAFEFVAHQREQFLGARLDNFVEHARKNGARRAVADAGDFDGRCPRRASSCQAQPWCALDFFGFGNGRAQSDGEIVGEMVAADGQGRRVAHHAAGENDQFGGAAADVQQAAAEFALVLREHGFGGGQRLERRFADHHAGAIHGGDDILRGRRRGGDDVHVDFEFLPDHADGIADAVLAIDAEIPGGARAALRDLREG